MSAPVLVFVVCVAACVVAHIAILVGSISARSTATGNGNVPRPRPVVEFIWALVPMLVLALVFTATWAQVRDRDRHPPEMMKVAQ